MEIALPDNAPALLLVPQAAFSRDRGERGSMQRKPRNRNPIAVIAARAFRCFSPVQARRLATLASHDEPQVEAFFEQAL
jgi:hypothetical protein